MKPRGNVLVTFATAVCILAATSTAQSQAPYSVTDLGVVNGASTSNAWGINAFGQVVGRQYIIGVGYSGFLWQNGQMTDLGIPSGYAGSHALAVSPLGDIAGTLETANGKAAFKWSGGLFTDLGN